MPTGPHRLKAAWWREPNISELFIRRMASRSQHFAALGRSLNERPNDPIVIRSLAALDVPLVVALATLVFAGPALILALFFAVKTGGQRAIGREVIRPTALVMVLIGRAERGFAIIAGGNPGRPGWSFMGAKGELVVCAALKVRIAVHAVQGG